MKRIPVASLLLLMFALAMLSGCGGSASSNTLPALDPENVNLIFVASPDLVHQAPGDVHPDTANLTPQGLQRSLMMASYLKEQVLGGNNVSAIYALSPMTHLQTANSYPNMAAIGYIQHFALLNRHTLPIAVDGTPYTGYSYPLNVAYAPGSAPKGVSPPTSYCPDCSGLDFRNTEGANDRLVADVLSRNIPGYYVFSAPWETINAMMTVLNSRYAYGLNLPARYTGPNHVYAVSVPLSGNARLVTYDSKLNPPATYPELPSPVATIACTHSQQAFFSTSRIGGVDGVVIPENINRNQRVDIIRHAEAHPDPDSRFENGNFVAAGQWRALELPNALRDTISPDRVYSIDPAQWFKASSNFSYVRPSLTVLPFAIANNLPYQLVSHFLLGDSNQAQLASDYFFTGGRLSNQIVLLGWESSRIKPLINALLASYGGDANLPLLPTAWPHKDYDTIWTVKIDAQGNLTVDNALCQGIDTTELPETAPFFDPLSGNFNALHA